MREPPTYVSFARESANVHTGLEALTATKAEEEVYTSFCCAGNSEVEVPETRRTKVLFIVQQ
eukprot:m.377206 g.377206  ORF g.377206 m.377206 type:complete len:62 (+) comp20923_c0_seq87:1439-1624(+)